VTALVERREALHRRALLFEYCTLGWNVVEAVVALGPGILAQCVALIAFGADSDLDAVADPLDRAFTKLNPDQMRTARHPRQSHEGVLPVQNSPEQAAG
jgi:hypothetical protein